MPFYVSVNSCFIHRPIRLVISILLQFNLFLAGIISGFGQTILAGWNFEDKNSIADIGIAENLQRQITSSSPSTVNYVSGSGGTGTFSTNNINWDNGQNQKFWQISFSTTGYKSLKLSSKQYSSNTGPRDFRIQYSFDGIDWTDTGILITAAANFTKGVLNETDIPVSCENQTLVYIRWVMNSNIAVNGTTVGSSGSSRIDEIQLNGCLIPLLTSALNISVCSGSPVNYLPEGTGISYHWQRLNLEGINETGNSGYGLINEILHNTTNHSVDVPYNFIIENSGCSNNQYVTLTVNPTPVLVISSCQLTVCPSTDSIEIAFSDSIQLPETSHYWEWTNLNKDVITVSPANGHLSPIKISVENAKPGLQTETSVNVTATTTSGCSNSQEIRINSGDNSPPLFTSTIADKNFCVQDITNATSNGSDDILETRPEYYLFATNDISLDINPELFVDNCTNADELILHWQVELNQNSTVITGMGQPSAIVSSIIFPGDALNQVSHTITYWLEDKYGNLTPMELRPKVRITVKPRPIIVQNF